MSSNEQPPQNADLLVSIDSAERVVWMSRGDTDGKLFLCFLSSSFLPSLPPSLPSLAPLLTAKQKTSRKDKLGWEWLQTESPTIFTSLWIPQKQFTETTGHPRGGKQEEAIRFHPGVDILGKASQCLSLLSASPESGHLLLAHGGGNLAETMGDTETFNSVLFHIILWVGGEGCLWIPGHLAPK